MRWESVNENDRGIIRTQIRREPKHLHGIARRCVHQCPQVIVNHPLPQATADSYFFPTVFWLTCPEAVRQIHRLEDQGVIQQLQNTLNERLAFRQNLQESHREYIFIRRSLLDRNALLQLKKEEKLLSHHLERLGIGGSHDLDTIKCLHMHYAHYLATRNNPVGQLVKKMLELYPSEWQCQGCHKTPVCAGVAE